MEARATNPCFHLTYTVDENNNVIEQTDGTNTIKFVYDSSSSPIYMEYNGVIYYYEENLQGDIVAILDANGNTVVEYTYDIWGKLLGITGELADTLGVVNPLRYRGYYYDTETGLYYLQSRYYSPELMRFISQDEPYYSNEQGQPLGSNLYVYCLNDCVNECDSTGKALIKFLALGIQLSLSIGSLSLGFEFLWDLKNGAFYPFLFVGGGKSISVAKGTNYVKKYIVEPLKKVKKTPASIMNALGKLSISVSAIVVFGNSKQKMPKDYQGWFNSFSVVAKIWLLNVSFSGAFARNSNGYIASFGLGLSSSCSLNFGKTFYIQLNANIKNQLSKLIAPLKSKAKSVQNKIQTAAKILF